MTYQSLILIKRFNNCVTGSQDSVMSNVIITLILRYLHYLSGKRYVIYSWCLFYVCRFLELLSTGIYKLITKLYLRIGYQNNNG